VSEPKYVFLLKPPNFGT